MIQKVIRLSDYPFLSKFVSDGKTIIAVDKKNYYVTLNQIKGKQLIYTHEYEADKNTDNRENIIELYFDTNDKSFLKLYNGTVGDKGSTGDIGDKGPTGDPYPGEQYYDPKQILKIINDDVTDDSTAVWSAYRGKIMESFLKSIAEIFISDDEYQLLFNEQVFIDMEFITENNNQTTALVHNDNKEHKTYIKYWTYEDNEEIVYYINIGTEIEPIYEEVTDFDLWNDLYLNDENNNTYYTRRLVVTSYDEITGEPLTSEYVYDPITKPVWIDLEFITDNEDDTTTLLYSVDGNNAEEIDKPVDTSEDDIEILYKPITSISVEGNKDITMGINSILTKTINIEPIDYVNAYIVIEYDDEYIKVFEDGRIMALNNPCPEGTVIKLYAKNAEDTEYDETISDELKIHVVVYISEITLDKYNFEGLSGDVFKFVNKDQLTELEENENNIIYYHINPINSTNKDIIWEVDEEFNDEPLVSINNDTQELTLLREGKVNIIGSTIDGSDIGIEFEMHVITPVSDIEVNESYDMLIGYTTTINVNVLPENATHKELSWRFKDEIYGEIGNRIIMNNDNQSARIFVNDNKPFTIIVSSLDNSPYENSTKEITINPIVPVLGITLEMNEFTINKGDTFKLNATIDNDPSMPPSNPELRWESSNPDIISVNQNGMITAVDGGTATITVYATDGSNVKAQCSVISVILITDIIINNNETIKYHLNNNYPPINTQIIPLNANITSLTWYTSDESIASIDNNGNMIMHKEGNIKVYAAANDDSGIIGSANVEITIPTQQMYIAIDNDNLNFNDENEGNKYYELNMNVDETYTPIIYVEPDNTSNQNLEYIIDSNYSSHSNVISIDDNGNIIALSQGYSTVFIKTTDNSGLSLKLIVNVL